MTRRYESLLVDILDRVMSGDIAPGEWLPKEVDLADEFGTSRGVAREAIRALNERGVIAVRHGRGARLLPPEEWNVLDEVVVVAVARSDNRADLLAELVECRRVIEPEVPAWPRTVPRTMRALV